MRDSVNTTTVGHVMSAAEKSVNKLLDMLEYTGAGETVAMDGLQTGIAREILQRANELSTRKPIALRTTTNTSLSLGPGKTVVATFRLDNGNTFSVDTGLNKNALRHQMNVVIGIERADKTGETEEKSSATAGDAKKALLEDLKQSFARAQHGRAKADGRSSVPQWAHS